MSPVGIPVHSDSGDNRTNGPGEFDITSCLLFVISERGCGYAEDTISVKPFRSSIR